MNPEIENQVIREANKEVFVTVRGSRTGKEFTMREYTYGVISADHDSPLSCTSVANSSISIDLWKGCAFQCSYCHVQDGLQDLDKNTMTMPNKPEPRSRFTADQVIDSLVEHPFFIPNESVISIGTASTEPFAAGKVADSTFEIMENFTARGYKNPFWIVTKAGFPKKYKEQLAAITGHGNQVMISVCWANNPKEVEPATANRFKNLQEAHDSGATISWYLRPLADVWSTDKDRLEQSFKHVSKYSDYIDMIIPGGLRWTEGIEYGVEEVRGYTLPPIPKDDNIKELSDETWDLLHELSSKYFPNTPVYHKSSCGLSYMLRTPNSNLVQFRDVSSCKSSTCPDHQRKICEAHKVPDRDALQERLATIGLGGIKVLAVEGNNGQIVSDPPLKSFTFAIRHMIEMQLAKKSSYES